MLCEDYPSLFDNAKIRNNLGECKENREFNFPLTLGLVFTLVIFLLYSRLSSCRLVLSYLANKHAG
jgi:hypothetical protein